MENDHVDKILGQWARERPDLDVSPMGIIGRLYRIRNYMDPHLKANFKKLGLNVGEFDVIATIRRGGPPYQQTPTELFKSIMLSSGAMTNRLDRLESMGLIERLPDPNDRRGTLIRLTEAGKQKVDEAVVPHVETETELVSVLSPEEQKDLARLLKKMTLAYEKSIP